MTNMQDQQSPENVNKRSSRREAKREEILDAALSAFTENGYDAASMDYIAEKAGASKRTVYNHFGSKEELFQLLIDRLASNILAYKQITWDADRPLLDQLTDFAMAKGMVTRDPASLALLRVAIDQSIRDPELVSQFAARFENSEDSLETWLRQAHDAGAMQVENTAAASQLFWAMASGALFWPPAILGQVVENDTEIAREIAQTFLARFGA